MHRPASGGSVGPRGKLLRVAVPNLTRDDAAARAELLAVQSYDLQLDVTDGAGHAGERHVPLDDDASSSPAAGRARTRSST